MNEELTQPELAPMAEYVEQVRKTAHDLRNNLGAILALARALELKNPGRPVGEIVADIVDQVVRAGEKLDHLGELSEQA